MLHKNRIRLKPSKPASMLGVIVGIIFVFIGLTMAIPTFGMFGVFWTLIAVAITGFNAYNLFSQKGAGYYEVEVTQSKRAPVSDAHDFEDRLRKLERLRQDDLINETEYQKKRDEILREKW